MDQVCDSVCVRAYVKSNFCRSNSSQFVKNFLLRETQCEIIYDTETLNAFGFVYYYKRHRKPYNRKRLDLMRKCKGKRLRLIYTDRRRTRKRILSLIFVDGQSEQKIEKECISGGCVLSAAVAV